MDQYSTSPGDFRDGIIHTAEQIEKVASAPETLEPSAHVVNNFNNRLDNLANTIETVKTASIKIAEESYIEMKHNAKTMGYNGDSIDDMSKLASDFAEGLNLDTVKVASAFSLIERELKEAGNTVVNGITKVASQDVDYKSEFFTPIEKLATHIDVIAAADELMEGILSMKTGH